jgi:hypothetical protein
MMIETHRRLIQLKSLLLGGVIIVQIRVIFLIDALNNLHILNVGNQNVQGTPTDQNATQNMKGKKCFNC